jgi:3-mercaptopyruvate sulfurtransferase SseA
MRLGLISRFGAMAMLAMLMVGQARCPAQFLSNAAPSESAFSIPQAQLIQPEDLNRLLQSKNAAKPLILQVGSHVLYAEAHIKGAEYVGPGSQLSGLRQLQQRVAPLSRKTFIVLYCGCCPWNHCPNVGSAFRQLHDLGFTHVKVLYLPENLGVNWVNKGYPVE